MILPLAAIVVFMALNRAVLIRGYERVRELAATDGAPSSAYRTLARRVERVELLSGALVLVAIYVMVARPLG